MTANQIIAKVEQTQSHTTSALDITLTLIDTNGDTRNRRIQTLTQKTDNRTESITIFLSPASVSQTRFLTIEGENGQEQWMYLPALKQSRKIGSTESSGSFMGSDFSYSDMNTTTFEVNEAQHTLLETTNEAYIIESIPYDAKSNYGKTILWVDKETFVLLKVQMYDTDKITQIKELTTQRQEQLDGNWVATQMEMKTLSSGHRTQVTIAQAKFDIPIPSQYFSIQFLQTGRI
jgi:outer membrane lipoprotein-sorting protein